MFTKILLAYDGSQHAKRALAVALDLAQRYHSKVYAVSVAHIPEFADTRDEVNGALEDAHSFYDKALSEAREAASERGIALETRVVPGHPADALARFAEEEDCDLIVVGARGRSGVVRYILGSASEAIVRYAHCSVLVVRDKTL
ncbi:MAG: universal stress protein [Firmicutes bacterium]|nr:universal stress protein [Bacillota bacterium]